MGGQDGAEGTAQEGFRVSLMPLVSSAFFPMPLGKVLPGIFLLVFYLLPSRLAVYKRARHTPWIVAMNVFTGWTLFGWVVALGWAAGDEAQEPLPLPLRRAAAHGE